MKLLAQEEYGLRCILQLATVWPEGKRTLQEIAQDENLTVEYVAKLLRIFKIAGLVKTERGKTGGYRLSRDPSEITLKEVLDILNTQMIEEACEEKYTGLSVICSHKENCAIRPVWKLIQEKIDEVLNSLTLGMLLRSEEEMLTLLANK